MARYLAGGRGNKINSYGMIGRWFPVNLHSERNKYEGGPTHNMTGFFSGIINQHPLTPLSPEQKAENLKKLTDRAHVPGAQLALSQSPSKKSVKITPSPLNSDLLELTNASMHARPSSWLEAASGRTPSSTVTTLTILESDLPELENISKTPTSPSKPAHESPKTTLSNNSFSWLNTVSRNLATPLAQETPTRSISKKN